MTYTDNLAGTLLFIVRRIDGQFTLTTGDRKFTYCTKQTPEECESAATELGYRTRREF